MRVLHVTAGLRPRLHTATRHHAGAIAFFGALAVVWTWPLVLHFTSAVPGRPGDNYTFLWMLWWMRRALSDSNIAFFHTTHLFFPFGTSLVNHSHFAFPALLGATVFGGASLVVAQNILVLMHVFLNGIVTYGFAWSVTRHHRASILAGVLFGTSPYLAAHLLGHFELLAAWPLPAFAWALRCAFATGSRIAVAVASAVLVATAYTTYYYVVYLGVLAVTYFIAWTRCISIRTERRSSSPRLRVMRAVLVAAMAATTFLVLWILTTGGGVVKIGSATVGLTRTHNPLTFFWLLAVCQLLTYRHVAVRLDFRSARVAPAAISLAMIGLMFAIGTLPLLWGTFGLMRSGEYVSQQYYWRSAPAGVDLIAPLLGHPFHPLVGAVSRQLYAFAGTDIVESIAWVGVVPVLLLLVFRVEQAERVEARHWWIVAAVFAIWALGPNLMIAGIDAGMPLPQTLVRFVPIASNARIPGRAMVVVYLAVALLAALRLATAGGSWGRPRYQWALIAALVIEYMAAPVVLTHLSHPAPYKQLAAAPRGGVCHVPFIMGDGLRNFGPYDLSVMYSATLHEHPIAGGFSSRMPPGLDIRYASLPIAGDLLALARGGAAGPFRGSTAGSPCSYIVVNRASAPPEALDYIRTLPLRPLAGGDGIEVYTIGADPP
jgi:hypothetical protein